jgi:membrane protease YdiL (CAAX protease family)
METTAEGIVRAERSHLTVTWSLIGAMLFLRIAILGVIGIFTSADLLITTYEVGTYLLTALFLWWEIENLKEYHIDTLALLIIIVFKPIQTLILRFWGFPGNALAFPHLPALLMWAIALVLAIACWIRRKDLPKFEWKSLGFFGLGILAGIILGILLAIPMSYQVDYVLSPAQFWNMVKQQGLTIFLYQVGYAGVAEEPLFRGFLWGALRKTGWKDLRIWLLQAGLFTLAHMYYFGRNPISLFIIVPVGALAIGLVAWKTRSISSSLALHGTDNAFGILWAELARYFLR